MKSLLEQFSLSDRVVVITGGAGLLGRMHAEAVAEMGGTPVLIDLNVERSLEIVGELQSKFQVPALALGCDITDAEQVQEALGTITGTYHRVDGLVNNAANNPKMEDKVQGPAMQRLESFPVEIWDKDLAVGLTGAFLCSKYFGAYMAHSGHGVILNIASDLALIGPDQRIYRESDVEDNEQPVKPVTYTVVKAGLMGLTRYLATYWADRGVRANALVPGGVYNGQGDAFVKRLTHLIPMGRMAHKDEYKAAVVFLLSEASSYMTGVGVVIDGGRTCW